MSAITCTEALGLLAIGAGTYFWLWYLTWEYEHYRLGKRKKKWWNTDIKDLFRRK